MNEADKRRRTISISTGLQLRGGRDCGASDCDKTKEQKSARDHRVLFYQASLSEVKPSCKEKTAGCRGIAFSRVSIRIDKFTQTMQEALQTSHDVASEFNQQEITNEHSLIALLDQSDGIARPLLEKIGASPDSLRELLQAALQKLPAMTGAGIELRIRSLICPAEMFQGSKLARIWKFGSREVGQLSRESYTACNLVTVLLIRECG